jgi:hypothetical protein
VKARAFPGKSLMIGKMADSGKIKFLSPGSIQQFGKKILSAMGRIERLLQNGGDFNKKIAHRRI